MQKCVFCDTPFHPQSDDDGEFCVRCSATLVCELVEIKQLPDCQRPKGE